ncbi:DUF6297 family protein [Spirillospora sp. NPDC047418]
MTVRAGALKSWSGLYTSMLGAVMAVLLLGPVLTGAVAGLPHQVTPSRMGAGIALVALAYAGYLVLARAFGPVATSAAWLVLSPLPRRRVLRRTVTVLLGISLVSGLVLALGLLSAVGVRDQFVVRLLAAAVLGMSATFGGMAAAVLAQASQTWDGWLLAAIAVVVLFAVIAALHSAGRSSPGVVAAGASAEAWTAAAVAAAGVAAMVSRAAWAALGRVPAHSILAASTRTGNVATAATVLDPGALTWIAEDAHWRRRVLRSRPLPGVGRLPGPLRTSLTLAWPEWRRLARRPGRSALVAASAALPALAARAGGGLTPAVLVAVVGGALAVAAGCASGTRRDAHDPSLLRLSAAGTGPVLAARALVPALAGGAWLGLALTGLSLAGALGAGPWWPFGPAAAPALAAGALRMARRRPVDHSMPVVATPFGVVPMGPVLWALAGVDLAALGCAPLLMAMAGQAAALGPLLLVQALVGTVVAALYLMSSSVMGWPALIRRSPGPDRRAPRR